MSDFIVCWSLFFVFLWSRQWCDLRDNLLKRDLFFKCVVCISIKCLFVHSVVQFNNGSFKSTKTPGDTLIGNKWYSLCQTCEKLWPNWTSRVGLHHQGVICYYIWAYEPLAYETYKIIKIIKRDDMQQLATFWSIF